MIYETIRTVSGIVRILCVYWSAGCSACSAGRGILGYLLWTLLLFQFSSLARLFRSLHFDILDWNWPWWSILTDYCQTCGCPPRVSLIRKGFESADGSRWSVSAGLFRTHSEWSEWIEDWNANRKRTVAWGSGSKPLPFLPLWVQRCGRICCRYNPYRQGNYIPGGHWLCLHPFCSYQPDNVMLWIPFMSRKSEWS